MRGPDHPGLGSQYGTVLSAARTRCGITLCAVIAAGSVASSGQAIPQIAAEPDKNSCRIFVQEFYDWYTPISISDKDRLTVSLRARRLSFEPGLWKMLVADDEAQSKANEIVGLDFDPILNSQDPSSKFIVESVSVKDGRCKAAVVGVEHGFHEEHVVPELLLSNGRWVFLNFHYQNEVAGKLTNSDLVQVLKELQTWRSRDLKEKSP